MEGGHSFHHFMSLGRLLTKPRFKYIFYVDGSERSTIIHSYAEISKRYNLGGTNPETMFHMALEWMGRLADEWLLIFDDCNLSERAGFIPGRGKGNIIYTSRFNGLEHNFPAHLVYHVEPLAVRDAVELLLGASGLLDVISDSDEAGPTVPTRRAPTGEETALANEIVHELSCMPVCVDKAAAAVRERGMELDVYLKELRTQKVRVATDPRFKDTSVETQAAYATLELSYDQITAIRHRAGRSEEGRAALFAKKVLNLLSCYHYQGFSTEILTRAVLNRRSCNAGLSYPLKRIFQTPDKGWDDMMQEDGEGGWEVLFFAHGLQVLRRYSLVRLAPDRLTLSMHTLVHTWAQQRMDPEARAEVCWLAGVLLSDAMTPSLILKNRRYAIGLAPHIDYCFAIVPKTRDTIQEHDNARVLGLKRGDVVVGPKNITYPVDEYYNAHLLFRLGWFYSAVQQFKQAEYCWKTCLRLFKYQEDPFGWGAINTLTHLATLYHEHGFLGEAEAMHWEAIGRLEARKREREQYLLKELEKREFEEEKASVSAPQRGRLLKTALEKTTPQLFPALSSKEMEARIFQTFTATVVNPLARHRPATNRRSPIGAEVEVHESTDTAEDAVATVRKKKSAEETDSLDDLEAEILLRHGRLARVLKDQGRNKNAKNLMNWVVQKCQEELVEDSPELLRLQNEAKAMTEPKDMDWFKRRVDMMNESDTDQSLAFFQTDAIYELFDHWCWSMYLAGRYSMAIDMYKKFIPRAVDVYGYHDPKVLKMMRRMAEAAWSADRLDDAVFIAEQCLLRAEDVYQPSHMEVILATELLAKALGKQRPGSDKDAEDMFGLALNRAQSSLPKNHPVTERIKIEFDSFKHPQEPSYLTGAKSLEERWLDLKADVKAHFVELGMLNEYALRLYHFKGLQPWRSEEEYQRRLSKFSVLVRAPGKLLGIKKPVIEGLSTTITRNDHGIQPEGGASRKSSTSKGRVSIGATTISMLRTRRLEYSLV